MNKEANFKVGFAPAWWVRENTLAKVNESKAIEAFALICKNKIEEASGGGKFTVEFSTKNHVEPWHTHEAVLAVVDALTDVGYTTYYDMPERILRISWD
jgi:hypothetical protein